MIGAFAFLLTRTLKNFVRWRLRRLRQPRYLVASLAGLLYLWFVWGRHAFSAQARRGGFELGAWLGPHRDAIELLGAVGLALILIIAWVWPQSGALLRFSQAEIQFLFTAPVSRRSLIHFRLVRSQLVLLLGMAIGSLAFGGRVLNPQLWPVTLGFWLILIICNLHFMGIALLRTNLLQHGVSGARHSAVAVSVLGVVLLAVLVGAREGIVAVRNAFPHGGSAVIDAAVQVSHHGVLAIVLAPVRAMVHPALAQSMREFAREVVPALGILALNYAWVVRSDADFEEAAVESAERRARRLERRRAGVRAVRIPLGSARRSPFTLAPTGRPEVAVVWKNLISTSRLLGIRTVIRLLSLVAAALVIGIQVAQNQTPWRVLAGSLAIFAGILFVIGANLWRADLRQDLLELEILKTWPLSGWSLVAAEVAVPTLLLTGVHWILLASLLIILPRAGVGFADPSLLTASVIAIMIVAPGFDLVSVLLQNAAALLLPGWYALGAGRARGLEATGQRIIHMAMTLLALILVALPAAIVGGILYLLLHGTLGAWTLVPVAVSVTMVYGIEAFVAIAALGRVYDRLDPSAEGGLFNL